MADFLADARRAGCWCYGASTPRTSSVTPGSDGASGQRPSTRGAGSDARSPEGVRRSPEEARRSPEGARRSPERAPVAYDAPDYRGTGVVLVLGSEGGGLRPRVARACDELIALPLLGRIESLGVSAAAAAVLYEILQSRGASP
jgi:hypothetical protein